MLKQRSLKEVAAESRGRKKPDPAASNGPADPAPKAEGPAQTPPTPGSKKQRQKASKNAALLKFRLPDGAVFHASYDHGRRKWAGTLTAGDVVLEGNHWSLHKLLQFLGQLFFKNHSEQCGTGSEDCPQSKEENAGRDVAAA